MRPMNLAVSSPLPEERALFLYSPVGGGHRHASLALAECWRGQRPNAAVQQVDYLQFLPGWERRVWPGLYNFSVRHWPALWRGYRRWTNRPTEPSFVRDRVTHTGVARFAALLAATRPRLVVSTIGGAAALAGAARQRLGAGASFVNALVMTDYRGHRHWARHEADLLFVASDEAKADLAGHGVPPQRIFVAGIPIPAVASCPPAEKAGLRRRLGLGDDPVVLLASGAEAGYPALEEVLATLAELNVPLDVVTTSGRATGMAAVGRMRLFRVGFRADFRDWMRASDLVVGKLGGHTAAQTFAAGLPSVVYRPLSGQEEDNAAWAVCAGAAVWPRTRAALKKTVAELLDGDAGRIARARMSQAAAKIARPDAAAAIARLLGGALGGRA